MKNLLAHLKSGDWRALAASFLYFDTGFTVWLLYGPLAPFIVNNLALAPAEQGFLVAIPVLSAAILRVTFGNLYQAASGRLLALMGVFLSAIPPLVLAAMPDTPSLTLLLALGVFLGMGGASFAVALPMAGSNYPPQIQGLVLGVAAAGNIGAVLDGLLFPPLASHFGWEKAMAATLPLLLLAGLTIFFWARDRAGKSGNVKQAFTTFAASIVALIFLVLAAHKGWLGVHGKPAILILPVLSAVFAVAVLPRHYRRLMEERDTWVVILIYSITFGGFVGMSAYVSLLLIHLYQIGKLEAGLLMSALAFTGAMVRPVGGLIADRISGVRALGWLLAGIAVIDLLFALWTPPLPVGAALLLLLYLCFGLGNGATFQLVPHRWPGKTGVMTGLVGAAGGIGGFYLPVAMGIAQESTGSYHPGFALFGILAASAFILVVMLRRQWLVWAPPQQTLTALQNARI